MFDLLRIAGKRLTGNNMNCSRLQNVNERPLCAPSLRLVSGRQSTGRRRSRKTPLIQAAEKLMFVLAAGSLLWWGAESLLTNGHNSTVNGGTAKMTVAPGQSLWQIAAAVKSPNEQQTDVVNQIRSLNPSLQSTQSLSAGQTITVPLPPSSTPVDLHLAANGDSVTRSM
jgi:hypothetical protein